MSTIYQDGETTICVGASLDLVVDTPDLLLFIDLTPADMHSLALDLNEAADKKEFGS